MNVEFTKFDGKRYCHVDADLSRSSGILNFSHEISVTFIEDSGKWEFKSAWHVGVYEATWNANEEDDFEQSFPGLLGEMRKEMHEKEKQTEVR